MRRSLIVLITAAAFAACGKEPTSPTPQGGADNTAEFGATPLGGGAGFGGAFGRAPGAALLRRLPANLALSDAQKTQIKSLVQATATATKTDRQALLAIVKQARQARQNGASPDQVKAIMQQGAPIRDRLRAAGKSLREQIQGVLTADQKAWLAANAPKPCDRAAATPLTDAQKAQIKSLVTAFRDANKADLQTLRQTFQKAREARKSGATKDQVKAILDGAKPAAERVKAARQKLHTDVQAVLTDQQKASGCFAGVPGLRLGAFGPGRRI